MRTFRVNLGLTADPVRRRQAKSRLHNLNQFII